MSSLAVLCSISLAMIGQAAEAPRATADARLDAARKGAQAAGDATVQGDYQALADLTHPKILELMGGRDKMIELLTGQMAKFKEEGFLMESLTISGPGGIEKQEANLYAVVPTTLKMTIPGGTLTSNSYLIGVSADDGKTWTYIDGSPGAETIRGIFPELPQSLELPEKTPPKIERDSSDK